jgi:hypothetical protein
MRPSPGRRPRRNPILGLAVTAVVAATSVAGAAETPTRDAMLKACRGDLARFCATVAPGGGRIRDCMTAHLAELTPACRAIVETAAAKR